MESRSPRVVVVTRPTVYEKLLERHATLGQVRFFLEQRGQSMDNVLELHNQVEAALQEVERAIPSSWRRNRVSRADLDRFLFEPEDIVVAVGQDGLVANMAKYLKGQPVIGINPSPDQNPGILVPHPPERIEMLLEGVEVSSVQVEKRTMVEAQLDDGQRLLGLNEIFVGHQSHQSARYQIRWGDREERQSSSGMIVSTGTGATGWAKSIHRERDSHMALPGPTDPILAFFVREAWPSIATGTEMTEGLIDQGHPLFVVSEMDVGGVIFGDGIEKDRIEVLWGQRIEIKIAETQLHLVR
jgi:NAD kinase